MASQDLSAISRHLLSLANPDLDILQREQLNIIFKQLFADLAAGHSCSLVSVLVEVLQLSITQIKQLVMQSGLATIYSIPLFNLQATPVSYVCIDSGDLLYVSKYLAYELSLAQRVIKLTNHLPNYEQERGDQACAKLEQLAMRENKPNSEQLAAILKSVSQKFSIITGGPGTGKTTTVTLLLWLFYQLYGAEAKVKICAPTGKAAVRVRESIEQSIAGLQSAEDLDISTECFNQLLAEPGNFGTLHKLLGYIPQSIYFRHHSQNLLDVEILIIDESSMVGLPLFSKLFEALDTYKLRHVVLLGDKNQLSSVEEGYVFASLINLRKIIYDSNVYDLFAQREENLAAELKISNRNQGEIYALSHALLTQDIDQVKQILHNSNQVKLYPAKLSVILDYLFNYEFNSLLSYLDYAQATSEINTSTIKLLFGQLNQQAVLCLTNRGVLGCDNLNSQIERRIKQHLACADTWYSGRPIIILQNDYTLDLFNGDIGICLLDGDKVQIVFENGRQFIPEVLPAHSLAYAITIHKSQGSEYGQVNLILPDILSMDEGNNLLSRELVYTGVTRAKQRVTIFSSQDVILSAMSNHVQRNTGLNQFLSIA